MKSSVIALLFLLSFSAYAQDGYHEIEYPTCAREACFIVDSVEYGFIKMEDIDGYSYMEMNSESGLDDLNVDRGCYTGDADEAADIILAMAGNTNANYMNGGHFVFEKIEKTLVSQNEIELALVAKSDYSTEKIVDVIKVKRCE